MGKMYEDWNKLFCDQMVEEIKKFEKCPTKEQLCIIKDLIEVTNGLQEMEMDGAIRRIAEDRYGYDSGTGRFREDGMERFGRDAEMEFLEMFNAARGRGRRRDGRGRFIGNMGGPNRTVYYPPNPDDYPWEYPYYMMNDGKREFSGDRFESEEDRERMKEEREEMMNAGRGGRGGNRGNSSGDSRGSNRSGGRSSDGSSGGRGGRSGGSYNAYPNGQYDDEMYMLRQKDGMPIMTPYNAHDPKEIPKKLTKQQYEEWMEDILNSDGSSGPHFSKEQAKQAQQKVGLKEIPEEAFWAALNAVYSDTCEFFVKRNLNNIDTYAEFAKVFWFEDDDAVGGNEDEPNTQKLAAYYTAVVEH